MLLQSLAALFALARNLPGFFDDDTHSKVKSLSLISLATILLASCMTTPVSQSGGGDAFTVINSNPYAIVSAAQSVFANRGYSAGPVSFPDSISLDKPSGTFGKIMYGGYHQITSMRCLVTITRIPGTGNYRLAAKASVVQNAWEAGFESDRPLLIGSDQFKPLLRKIAAQASGAGPL